MAGEPIDPKYQAYVPTGIVDSLDGNTSRKGAMIAMENLMPSPTTDNLFICRPSAFAFLDFTGFTNPGYVSLHKQFGTLIVGFVASDLNPGFDQPFAYDTETETYLTITGITAANVPTSPATTGEWTPPTVDDVGGYIVFTHPGFDGTNGYYGWFDMTGFSLTASGDTNSNTTLDNLTPANPLTAGVTVGMTVTGIGIPAGTTVTAVSSSDVTMSQAASASATVTLNFSGGTTTSPLWASGNTNQNPLPGVPTSVTIFNDRAYFAVDNLMWYTDVLNPLNMASATQALTIGGNDAIITSSGQPLFTAQPAVVIASLLVFKQFQIWQITGDAAASTLALNQLSDSVGTDSPRSIGQAPNGTYFRANDGIRAVTLQGNVSPPNEDLVLPFINPPYPSRIAATFNTGYYRICSSGFQGGVLFTRDYWLDVGKGTWIGPHTITYDDICPFENSFLVTNSTYTAQILRSNVFPTALDNFVELGSNMEFNYQTVLIPEFATQRSVAIIETSMFMAFNAQVEITCTVIDQSYNILGQYDMTTQFYAPTNATNWRIKFVDSGDQSGTVKIPTRHAFQFQGVCSSGLGFGSLFVHYQFQANVNNREVDDTLPSSLDFGLVTDPILYNNMDWGSVVDSSLATVDFEAVGPLTGPP